MEVQLRLRAQHRVAKAPREAVPGLWRGRLRVAGGREEIVTNKARQYLRNVPLRDLEAARDKLGGVMRLQEALGVGQGTVSGWLNRSSGMSRPMLARIRPVLDQILTAPAPAPKPSLADTLRKIASQAEASESHAGLLVALDRIEAKLDRLLAEWCGE